MKPKTADVLTDDFIDLIVHHAENELCIGDMSRPSVPEALRVFRRALLRSRRETFTWTLEIEADNWESAHALLRRVLRDDAGALEGVRIGSQEGV